MGACESEKGREGVEYIIKREREKISCRCNNRHKRPMTRRRQRNDVVERAKKGETRTLSLCLSLSPVIFIRYFSSQLQYRPLNIKKEEEDEYPYKT